MIGTRLGPYEITAKLGEGGMGEVYRATDTKLERDVAIKVLPAAFTEDEARLSRFEREAKLLAQLHHPHIASIFGLEEAEGVSALVMELVEGPTLAERMGGQSTQGQSPLSIEEALPIARQIALALETAHEKGIIHRDLKPQNIKLTPAGEVKVLDFGLAKAMDPGGSATSSPMASPTMMSSPTLTAMPGTQLGIILGTAAYMAPEQARGQAVDKRADIWAFGVVLYEMLTGAKLFASETVSDTLAAVIRKEVDLDALPDGTPVAIRRLLRRCLARDPRSRLRDIGDARLVIEEIASGSIESDSAVGEPVEANSRRGGRLAWALSAALAAALAAVLWQQASAPTEAPRIIRSILPLPANLSIELDGSATGMPAISPDGTRIAFGAREGAGPLAIWVLDLETGMARPLPGTEGGARPFWSPDGREIGFFTWYSLSTISATGGPVTRLTSVRDARGGSWSPKNTILFAPHGSGPLYTVPARGGAVRPETGTDEEVAGTHRFPHFLPDGEHYLYLDRPTSAGAGQGAHVALRRLGSKEARTIVEGATNAMYADGYLLYVRDRILMAQPFDPDRLELTGAAQPLIEDTLFNARFTFGIFSVSEGGVLAFQTGRHSELSQLVWRDRSGRHLGTLGTPGILSGVGNPAISPDGAWAVMPRSDPTTSDADLWLFDLERGTETRLARGVGDDSDPVFSEDSRSLNFDTFNLGGVWQIWSRDLATGREEAILEGSTPGSWVVPRSFAPDGRQMVLARMQLRGLTSDLLLWRPGENSAPTDLLVGPHDEGFGQVSPDGRWMAWASDETGRHEVYVAGFPELGSRIQISQAGGTQPRWAPTGTEIFFLDAANWLTVVSLETRAGTLSVGSPERLFQVREFWTWPYAVAPDGERFLVREPLAEADASPLTLLTDWTALLESR